MTNDCDCSCILWEKKKHEQALDLFMFWEKIKL